VDPGGAAGDESSRPDFSLWRQKNSDALVAGSVTRLADGRYDVRVRLWDVVRGQDQGGQSHAVVVGDLRLAAHRIADFVYEKLTGDRGAFSTRVAYVTKSANAFNLWVADADGENPQSALNSPEPIISPAWSPNGAQLAYVSFEARKPTSQRAHEVASWKAPIGCQFQAGSNSAPAWSSDGRFLAVTLSRGWRLELYLLDAQTPGAEPRRPIQSTSIDTSRCSRPMAKRFTLSATAAVVHPDLPGSRRAGRQSA